jgi:hypothetical protein
MDSTCYVYWIHRPCETDLLTQGYVGITNNPELRWKQHQKEAVSRNTNHKFYNSLRLHSDFIFEILIISDRGYCLELEQKLRPQGNIGLNYLRGGSYTPSDKEVDSSTREKLSIAAKQAYIDNPSLKDKCGRRNSNRILTEEHKKKISESGKGIQKAWLNAFANKEVWLLAEDMYKSFISDECTTYYSLSKKFNFKVHQTQSIFQMFKNGWNPFNDIDYQTYKKKELKCH